MPHSDVRWLCSGVRSFVVRGHLRLTRTRRSFVVRRTRLTQALRSFVVRSPLKTLLTRARRLFVVGIFRQIENAALAFAYLLRFNNNEKLDKIGSTKDSIRSELRGPKRARGMPEQHDGRSGVYQCGTAWAGLRLIHHHILLFCCWCIRGRRSKRARARGGGTFGWYGSVTANVRDNPPSFIIFVPRFAPRFTALSDPPPRAPTPTNGRPGFPFGFLGASGRLPKARRGRVLIV